MMKAKDMRNQDEVALKNTILNLRKEQVSMRMQLSSGSTKVKVHRFKAGRKEIAAAKTILEERKRDENE